MLLSVVIYNHKLTGGQWLGAAVVFAGISVEAFVKRKGSSTLTNPKSFFYSLIFRRSHQACHPGKRKSENQIFVTLEHIYYLDSTGPTNANRRTVIHSMPFRLITITNQVE